MEKQITHKIEIKYYCLKTYWENLDDLINEFLEALDKKGVGHIVNIEKRIEYK